MEKKTKIILCLLLLVSAVNLWLIFSGTSPGLKKAIRELKATRDSITLAISEVNSAQAKLDTLSNSLQELKRTALRSQLEVQIINGQLRLKTEKSRAIVDSLQKEINSNFKKLSDL